LEKPKKHLKKNDVFFLKKHREYMGIVGLLQTMVTPKSNGLEGAEKTDYIIYIPYFQTNSVDTGQLSWFNSLGGWLMCSLSRGLMYSKSLAERCVKNKKFHETV
jgi:hypothetical protein